jgi:hypothetical protein
VTVLGAAGGIGQPLSLLLKLNPRVTELALYDIRMAPGKHHLSCPPSIGTPVVLVQHVGAAQRGPSLAGGSTTR